MFRFRSDEKKSVFFQRSMFHRKWVAGISDQLSSAAPISPNEPHQPANHTSPEPSLCRGICISFQVILQLLNTRGHIAHKLEDMCYIERQLHKRGAGLATKMMVDQEGHSLDFFCLSNWWTKPHDRWVKQEAVSHWCGLQTGKKKSISAGMIIKRIDHV